MTEEDHDVEMERINSRSDLTKDIKSRNSDSSNYNINNTTSNYPNIGLGEILYPTDTDLKDKIKLFSENTDEDAEFISSSSNERSCQIEFENESISPIYCFWIKHNSDIMEPGNIITPKGSLRLNTYLTHPFIISRASSLNKDNFNTIIAVYIPTSSKHNIHLVTIDENLTDIEVESMDEEINARCKCGRELQETDFKIDEKNDNDQVDECFACEREICEGDRVWICDNLEAHILKIYCLSCAQQRSQPLGIIRAFTSDMNADYCCNQKYKKYPRNFPRLFQTHQFIENGLRVLSLITDLILIYKLVKVNLKSNDGFFDDFDALDINRIIFTFLSGFLMFIMLLVLFVVYVVRYEDDDDVVVDKRSRYLKIFCVVLTLISLIFFYKIIMIGLSIYRIVYTFKYVSHGRPVSSDVEIKHIYFLYPLLYDQILSGWPLLVISLIELVDFEHKLSLYSFSLFIKVISSNILLFIDVDRLRLWRYSLYDPKMLVPVCILHRSRPYPMKTIKLDDDTDKNCVSCGEHCEKYIWSCTHSACNDTVCMECAWEYLGKYQQYKQLGLDEFYEQLIVSTSFMKIYSDQIEKFAEENDLGNIQKPCWGYMNGYIWSLKFIYNICQICLLLTGCWIFKKVWLSQYFNNNNNNNIYNTSTIYGSLFVCIASVFKLILIIIQCQYLLPKSKIEKYVPRIMFNLFFAFYIFGYALLLFDYKQLSEKHIFIKLA
eukprot:554886_1